jgi:hypothetical protein
VSQLQANPNHGFSLYPNPATSTCKINYQLQIGETGTVQICDMMGRVQITHSLSSTTHEASLDVSTLTAGMYLVRYLINGEPQQVSRLAVLH